jgi:F-type H+-transporting ATPase subunit delta
MSEYNISSRYAKALLDLAEEKQELERVYEDMYTVNQTLRDSKELRAMLKSPVVKDHQKHDILDGIFKEHINRDSLQFLHFIVDKNRENYLFDISNRFIELYDHKQGIVKAEIKSSAELNDEQKDVLSKKLAEYTGKKVEASYRKDDAILGGFIVRIGDTVLDASVNRQLQLLKERLLQDNSVLNQ